MWLNQNENYAKKANRPNFLLLSKNLSNQRYLKYPLAKNILNCCAYIINKSLIHCDVMAQENPEKNVVLSGLPVTNRVWLCHQGKCTAEWCSLHGIWYRHPYQHCRHQTFPKVGITKSVATQYKLNDCLFIYNHNQNQNQC